MKNYSKHFVLILPLLVIAAYFLVNIPFSSQTTPISGFFIIFLALPCFIALFVSLDWKKAAFMIIVLGIYAFTIETFAILTGFPYSNFQYTELIGFKLFGLTPYTLPFAYVPIFIGCFYLANLQSNKKINIILISTSLILISDVILDPAAVALKFWIYDNPGFFYGVPFLNFLGWILTGFVASLIGLYLIKDNRSNFTKPKALVSSLFLIIVFWTAVCSFLGLIFSAIVGIFFLLFVLYKTNFNIADLSK